MDRFFRKGGMDKKEFHFLLVDDDLQFLESTYQLITRKGYQCTRVSKPEDAVNLVRIKPFHGAIVDCMLPQMNGVKLVQEFRNLRFGKAPVVLISGIFKDKNFSADALSKTDAIDFLHKPVEPDKIFSALQKMAAAASGKKEHPPLNKLLSGPGASPRAQIKTIEQLEKITGFDFAFVLSALLKIGFSGYLNVVVSTKKIFGLTFSKGHLLRLDADDQFGRLFDLLISNKYLDPSDVENFTNGRDSNNLLTDLIKLNLLSPHAADMVLSSFIISSLSDLFLEKEMEFSLSPSPVELTSGPKFGLTKLYPLFHDFSQKVVTFDHLKNFYDEWDNYPLRKTEHFIAEHPLFSMPMFSDGPELIKSFAAEPTMKEVNQNHIGDLEIFYRCLHLLTLTDIVRFDERPRALKGSGQFEELKRYRTELASKDPQEIFVFFGASQRVVPSEVESIYKEFAKANHPDRIPNEADKELVAAVTEVYGMVSNAYKVLSTEKLRQEFFDKKRQNEATLQIKAEAIVEEGLNLLRKGQVTIALETLRESQNIYKTDRGLVTLRWAEVKKIEQNPDPSRLDEILKELEGIDVEERRGPYCQLVLGLIYKAKKDLSTAYDHIDRALVVDPSFIDARRELAAITKMNKKGQNSDFLTGDLTASITNLFKKKLK